MGRPTKKEQLKRKVISQYFKRDSEIYTTFEKMTEGLNKEKIVKLFIEECGQRRKRNYINGRWHYSELFPLDKSIYFQDLYNISKTKHDFYVSILCLSKCNLPKCGQKIEFFELDISNEIIKTGQPNSHQNNFIIDEYRLIEILGKDKVEKLNEHYHPSTFNGYGYGSPHLIAHVLPFLADFQKKLLQESIKKNPMGIKTIINKSHGTNGTMHNYLTNSYLVEIDFTQPLEEIEKHIKHLHEEYHKNKLPNVYDFLNIERKPTNQKEIYKTNAHKDFNILLADKLFIYDSKVMGLTLKYIEEEIIKYHTEIMNFSNDKIIESTIKDYLSFMVDLIENGELINYAKGFQ